VRGCDGRTVLLCGAVSTALRVVPVREISSFGLDAMRSVNVTSPFVLIVSWLLAGNSSCLYRSVNSASEFSENVCPGTVLSSKKIDLPDAEWPVTMRRTGGYDEWAGGEDILGVE